MVHKDNSPERPCVYSDSYNQRSGPEVIKLFSVEHDIFPANKY